MPKLRIMTEEEKQKLLSTRNSAPIYLTPEEKLDMVFQTKMKKGVSIRKFHFNAIENGTKLVLFNGLKVKVGEFSKDRKGIIEARVFARKLFLLSPTIYRNGGFTFDCLMIDEFGALKEKEL